MKNKWLIFVITVVAYTAVYFGMQHNLAIKTAALQAEPITVVIDAGHGGEDGGAVSKDGIRESEINLSISQRLEQVLALCGIRTKMVRTSDQGVHTEGDTIHDRKVSDLKNRAAIVNETAPAVLVSIHQNHFEQEKYSGAQVFYAASKDSKDLAAETQKRLRDALCPENRRECKPADTVYLMEQINCTGILVECGFLSNWNEAKLLQTSEYQTKLACAIAGALAQFLEEGEHLEV